MQNGILQLMKAEPEKEWVPVLSIDTDSSEVVKIDRDAYCNYDVGTIARMPRWAIFCPSPRSRLHHRTQ